MNALLMQDQGNLAKLAQEWDDRATLALLRLARDCEFNVRELALRLGISRWSLQRFFKSRLASSPRAWLREQRLQAARRLLDSGMAVKAVAYEVKFRSQAQFCRDYKARFGHTPSATSARRYS